MNKTAVALAYHPEDHAPRIVATGKGYLADKILSVAQEEHVPVHKDEALANTLSKLELGECIPPELYDVVAKILVYVDHVDGMKSEEYVRHYK